MLLLKKHFWLLSMLKTVVLLHIFLETKMWYTFIFQDSLKKEVQKNSIYLKQKL